METFLSTVLGDLTSRSINFIFNKCSKLPAHRMEESLQRAVIRAQIIVDEAMGRDITNQAMLLQLNMLRDAMHQGHYVLDTLRYQPNDDEEDAKDQSVSSSLSIVNSAKRLCFSSRGALTMKELQETLTKLRSMILDVNELVLFLTSYPRLYRQPYMHLQLANCMFGRQMEAQLVINFLLHVQPHGPDEELEVLPIVGPGYVGKSTLVTHVCKDERERAHFSEILSFHIHGFTDDEQATFIDECELKHQNRLSGSNLEGRLLIVIELIGDLNEEAWGRLYFTSKKYASIDSKIIVTSRFDSIVKFGTTRALTLKFLSHEAYWYFFKTLTFGSTDPEMHPRLMHLALEIANMTLGPRCYITAIIIGHLLNDNFDVKLWSELIAFKRRSYQKLVSQCDEHPFHLPNQNRLVLCGRMPVASEDTTLYHRCQHPSEEEIPKIKFRDVLCGSVMPHGKFEVLAWRSRIPPYYSYVYTCKIEGPKTGAVKRKRSMKNKITDC